MDERDDRDDEKAEPEKGPGEEPSDQGLSSDDDLSETPEETGGSSDPKSEGDGSPDLEPAEGEKKHGPVSVPNQGPQNKRYSRSFEIAISSISCAIAAVFLGIGIFSGVLLATGYFIGVIALMLPLSRQCFRGDALAYVGTVILAIIMGAAAEIWSLVPFIMFFGLHPLVNALQIRYKVNRILAFFIKVIWFDCTLIVGYFLVFGGAFGGGEYTNAIFEFMDKYIYWIIFIGGTVVFLIYDYLIFRCQILINGIVNRVRR